MEKDGGKMTMEEWMDTGEGVAHQIWHERANGLMEMIWAFAGALLADGVIYHYDGAYDDTVWTKPVNCVFKDSCEYDEFEPQMVLDYWNAFDIFSAVGEILTQGHSAELQRVRFTLPIVEKLIGQGRFQAARAYERSARVDIKLYWNSPDSRLDDTLNFDRYLAALFELYYTDDSLKDCRRYTIGGVYAPTPGTVTWPRLVPPDRNHDLLTLGMLKPHGMQFAPRMPSACMTRPKAEERSRE
ncbi:hypothetical protein [Bifidobacterium ruminantium]|uniref:hypothetical protein n=1 Tax=Bifidobacterium ruminantium TaxID=78346 RepID=UPI002493A536|nr:hypothetical protein [Bifidobacterium ruminantium]